MTEGLRRARERLRQPG